MTRAIFDDFGTLTEYQKGLRELLLLLFGMFIRYGCYIPKKWE
jgi:hypothetical protein